MTRAVFSPATFVRCDTSSITLSLPNDTHRNKCEQHRSAVEQALADAVGAPVSVELVAGGGAGSGGGDDRPPSQPASATQTAAQPSTIGSAASQNAAPESAPRRAPDDDPPPPDDEGDADVYVLPEDDEVDVTDLVDAPPESVKTPIDRLAEAFPGSELIDDTY